MDSQTFDGLTKHVGRSLTRRGVLRNLVASAAAISGVSALLQRETAAKKRKKHKTHRSQRPREWCGRHGDGCGALNEDGEFTPPYCCHGYLCHYDQEGGTWTCQAE